MNGLRWLSGLLRNHTDYPWVPHVPQGLYSIAHFVFFFLPWGKICRVKFVEHCVDREEFKEDIIEWRAKQSLHPIGAGIDHPRQRALAPEVVLALLVSALPFLPNIT